MDFSASDPPDLLSWDLGSAGFSLQHVAAQARAQVLGALRAKQELAELEAPGRTLTPAEQRRVNMELRPASNQVCAGCMGGAHLP
jgi:hypothetical protein